MINAKQTLHLYLIRDDISQQISPLFYASSQADAERTFLTFLRSPDLSNPADYSLFLVGTLDTLDFKIADTTESVTPAGYQYRVNGATLLAEAKNE